MNKFFFSQILLIAILIILAATFAVFIFPDAYLFAWITGIFLVILGFYPFFKGIKEKKLDLFEPIYLFTAYFILEMAIRGIWDLKYNFPILNPFYNVTSNSFYYLLSKVFLYSILGLIFFYIGYYLKIGKIIGNSLPKIPKTYWGKSQLIPVIGLSFLIGALGNFLSIKSGITLGAFYLIYPFATTVPLLGLGILYIDSIIKKRRFQEFFFIFLIILFSSFLFFVLNTGKTIIFEAGLLILVIYNYFKKQITLKKALLILVFLLIISPIITGYYSFRDWKKTKDYYVFAITHPTKIFEPIIIRSYGTDAFLLVLDKTSEFKIGGSLSELLWFYIPRSLWPEKLFNYPYIFGQTYATDTQTNTLILPGPFVIPTLVGELYLNFAFVGIIVGFFLTGIIFRTIYYYFIQKDKGGIAILLYALLAPFILLFSQGAVGEGVSRVLIKLVLAMVIILPLMVKLPPKLENVLEKFK